MPKKIIFVCVGNSCRSQMAEGLARSLGGNRLLAYSAGSRPSGAVAVGAIEAMAEIGIDISTHQSKSVQDFAAQSFDYLVTMGCGDACPWLPARHRIDWQIPDPVGQPLEEFRRVRDLIESQIRELLQSEGLLP